jgi:hypothetical protein
MLIIPILNPGQNLFLDAYSYNPAEIHAVSIVLGKLVVVDFAMVVTQPDKDGREGVRHIVSFAQVNRLQAHWGIRFVGSGATTTIRVTSQGCGFRCKEFTARGPGPGCLNLSAKDDHDALVKCALLAGQSGWFGGDASPGSCQ